MIRLSIRLKHVPGRITNNYVSWNNFRLDHIGSGFQNFIHRQFVGILVNERAVFVLLVRNRLAQHGVAFWNEIVHLAASFSITLHTIISCL